MPSHGSTAVFRILLAGEQAGLVSVFDISDYTNTAGLAASRDTAEVTRFGNDSKEYLPGLKDATISFGGPYDQATDIVFDSLSTDEPLKFQYMPTGLEDLLFAGLMLLTSYEISSDVSDANALSGELQVTGDVVRELVNSETDGMYDDGNFIDGNNLSGPALDGGAA